jgi:hypothetical protein
MPALFAVLIGVLLGLATGGRLYRLAGVKLRGEWLILTLFVVQAFARGRLLGVFGASQWSLAVWTSASCVLIFTLLLNWRVPGMALGAVGILMNVDVVLVNMGMPVLMDRQAGLAEIAAAADASNASGGFYRLALQGDIFRWFGDTIPVALGRSVVLMSPGDVVLMVAVAVTIINGMAIEIPSDRLDLSVA